MRVAFKLKRGACRTAGQGIRANVVALLAGVLSCAAIFPLALAQSVPLPQVANVVNDPACAASANGTGHIICVVSQNSQLSAVSILLGARTANAQGVGSGEFPAQALDPIPQPTPGPLNPLPLGLSGLLGSSSCSSTADVTGEVVCAYSTGGAAAQLMGVRFSIFPGTQPVLQPVITQSLGMAIVGNAGCAIGTGRFQVKGPAAGEPVKGETICAFRSTGGELWGIAFNPGAVPQVSQRLDLGVVATGDPSCAGALDDTDEVICVFMTNQGLQGIAFDPRPTNGVPFKSPLQALYAGTPFQGNPGCTLPNPNDKPVHGALGVVICAIRTGSNTLAGFAFNPRNATLLPAGAPQPLGVTTLIGNPSCAGLGDGTNEVICGVISSASVVNSVKFDPRQNLSVMISTGLHSNSNLSCTFQNIHATQISCAGVLPGQNQLLALILSPLNAGVKALIANHMLL